MEPLKNLKRYDIGTIVSIQLEDDILHMLEEMGIKKGTRIRLESYQAKMPTIIKTHGCTIAMSYHIADRIYVKRDDLYESA